jgi:cell division protein FtsW
VRRLLIIAGVLLLLGVMTNYSITVSLSAARGRLVAVTPSVVKQAIIVAIGLCVFAVTAHIKYLRWPGVAQYTLLLLVLLLVAVLIPGVGREINGSRRWIGWDSLGLQPSQSAVVVIPLLAAKVFSGKFLNRFESKYYWAFLLFSLVVGSLVALEPDFGTAFVIIGSSLLILVGIGMPWGRWLACTAGIAGLGLVAVSLKDSWRLRMTSFIDPLAKAQDVAYQLVNSMFAFARGGVTGRGFMRSVQKFVHFPAQESDFVFAIFAEEFGFLGATVVVALYVVLFMSLLRLSSRCREPFARVYVMALGVFLMSQTIVNMGVVVGLLPTTGVPLPFFSQGGNHIVFEMAALGIAASIARSPESVS